MDDHLDNDCIFKITKKEVPPSKQKKKETVTNIEFMVHEESDPLMWQTACSMSAADFLAETYNTVILRCVPAIVSQRDFKSIVEYENEYKRFSNRLIETLPPWQDASRKQTDIYRQYYPDGEIDIFKWRDLFEKLSEHNKNISLPFAYDYSCGMHLVFDENITELHYIAVTCREAFFQNVELNTTEKVWLEELQQFKDLKNDTELYDYYKTSYHSFFPKQTVISFSVPPEKPGDNFTSMFKASRIADIVYICVMAIAIEKMDVWKICQNCGKAFVLKSRRKTNCCCRKCKREFNHYYAGTLAGKIYSRIEGAIKNNIYHHCQKGSKNHFYGVDTLEEWRISAAQIRDSFFETMLFTETYQMNALPAKDIYLYESSLIQEFKRIAEKHHFAVAVWPVPLYEIDNKPDYNDR